MPNHFLMVTKGSYLPIGVLHDGVAKADTMLDESTSPRPVHSTLMSLSRRIGSLTKRRRQAKTSLRSTTVSSSQLRLTVIMNLQIYVRLALCGAHCDSRVGGDVSGMSFEIMVLLAGSDSQARNC